MDISKRFLRRGYMFGGVKITLILCLTIVVSCVLFISYNEYTNRYTLIATNDNSLYIFDKKSTFLNKCDGKTCTLIETKLPSKTSLNFDSGFQQSKLFESEKPMVNETLEKVNVVEAKLEDPVEKKSETKPKEEEITKSNKDKASKKEKKKDEKQDDAKKDEEEKDSDDEFIE